MGLNYTTFVSAFLAARPWVRDLVDNLVPNTKHSRDLRYAVAVAK